MSATSLEHARAVADAVLYEGYLLYPYRANSGKNQSRWQFGVLGPPGADHAGVGEDSVLRSQLLVRGGAPRDAGRIAVHLRFLHLQTRTAQSADGMGGFRDVAELGIGDRRWLSWDEAVESELSFGPWSLAEVAAGRTEPVLVLAAEETEELTDEAGHPAGRLVRRRRPLHAQLEIRAERVTGVPTVVYRVSVSVENTAAGASDDRGSAIAASFIGAHLLLTADDAEFVSMTDPPPGFVAAAAASRQHRCWPVLAGPEGDRSVLLVSPIILYDHPELAPQSAGALFDSTEIDEILTLRVMTLTDEEKAAARATDPLAAAIIDRCDAMSPEAMQELHGVLRDPHALADVDLAPGSSLWDAPELPWWDPAVDASVSPDSDAVLIDGVPVAAGSMVRVRPRRRADAQDIFFTDQVARVCAVHSDVDGETHVAVVLADDPAADLHDWYGRYLYFAPEELEPIT
jgi:hypothetical protein